MVGLKHDVTWLLSINCLLFPSIAAFLNVESVWRQTRFMNIIQNVNFGKNSANTIVFLAFYAFNNYKLLSNY